MAERVGLPCVVRIGSFPLLMTDLCGVSTHRVCGDFPDEVTGGSDAARLALECGDVRLSDIPDELLGGDANDARIEWLEAKLGTVGRRLLPRARQWREIVESLRLTFEDAEEEEASE